RSRGRAARGGRAVLHLAAAAAPRQRQSRKDSPMSEKITKLTDEQWRQVRAVRAEWLSVGLSTEPVDRARAEAAITAIYRRAGRGAPQFVHVDSPAAACLAIWLMQSVTGETVGRQLWDQLGGQLGGQLWD